MNVAEIAAKLAVDGAVAAIGGTVRGSLGLAPRVLGVAEKIELGINEAGETLYYPVGDDGVFLHSNGAFTTIWFSGEACAHAIDALDAAIKQAYPLTAPAKDEAHGSEPSFNLRTYDIRLSNNNLAIVDAIYPAAPVADPRFMTRVSAMMRQN